MAVLEEPSHTVYAIMIFLKSDDKLWKQESSITNLLFSQILNCTFPVTRLAFISQQFNPQKF